jgi:hypothetical protein
MDPIYWKTTVDTLKKNHGLPGFWKWLDEQYPRTCVMEIKNNWWGKKKTQQETLP